MNEENEFTADFLLSELFDSDEAMRQRLEAQRHKEESKVLKLKINGIGIDSNEE